MGKIDTLNKYIERADEILISKDIGAARDYQDEVIGVYDAEIPNIRGMLDNYGIATLYGDRSPDFLGDVKILKAKLINHRENISEKLFGAAPADDAGEININQTTNVTTSITMTFNQTIDTISTIPEDILSEEDKEILQGKLAGIESMCQKGESKQKIWSKVGSVLKWIGDKGVEVGIAALPYIVEVLKTRA